MNGNQKSTDTVVLVEITGVTGAGKTTLAAALKQTLAKESFAVHDAHDIILQLVGLQALKHRLLRSILIDLIAFVPFLKYTFTREGYALLRLGKRVIWRDARNMPMAINLWRNYARAIGVYVLLRRVTRTSTNCDIILWDQGTLHIAHAWFIHVETVPDKSEIERFRELVPKPDCIIWVTSTMERSLATIMARGHKRVTGSTDNARAFVEHAHATYNILFADESLREDLLNIDNTPDIASDSAVIEQNAMLIATHLKQSMCNKETSVDGSRTHRTTNRTP